MRVWTILVAVIAALGLAASIEAAPRKKKKFEAPPGVTLNDCGCYQDGEGCKCVRGAVCGCPGDCEPVGCDEKRQREIEKETADAIKREKTKGGDKGGKSDRAKPEKPADKGDDKPADKAPAGDKAGAEGDQAAEKPAPPAEGKP